MDATSAAKPLHKSNKTYGNANGLSNRCCWTTPSPPSFTPSPPLSSIQQMGVFVLLKPSMFVVWALGPPPWPNGSMKWPHDPLQIPTDPLKPRPCKKSPRSATGTSQPLHKVTHCLLWFPPLALNPHGYSWAGWE
jgi:hypothetical protein